jgi:hypothetical protein
MFASISFGVLIEIVQNKMSGEEILNHSDQHYEHSEDFKIQPLCVIATIEAENSLDSFVTCWGQQEVATNLNLLRLNRV